MKPRFLLLLLIAGLLLPTGCEQTQLPSEPTIAPTTVSTTSATEPVTVPTAPPTTAPTTAPTTEPEPPKWLRQEGYMTYEEFFAEDRQYGHIVRHSDGADQPHSWYIMEGDVGTVYDLSGERGTIGYSLYLSDHSAGTREWFFVPGDLSNDTLLGCDGKYACFVRSVVELNQRTKAIVRLDMETKTMELIIRVDEIKAAYLCGDTVMYVACELADSVQICRIYLPEARVDVLCTLEIEPGLSFYSLQCPQSTRGDVTWSVAASQTEIAYRETYHCADGTVTREPFRDEPLTAAPEPELVEGEWQFAGTELQGNPAAEKPENATAVILGGGFRAGNPGYCAAGKVTRLSEDMALEAVEGTEGVFCITEENEVLQLSWDGSVRNVLYTGGEKPLGNLVYREGFLYLTEGENILQLRVEDGASRVLIHQPGLYQMRLEEDTGLYFRGGAFKAYIYFFGADDFYETT